MSLVAGPGRGGQNVSHARLTLATENHVKYIQQLDSRKDELQYWMTEHLRLNGVYWGITALYLLNEPTALPRDATIDFVLTCQNADGGFGAAPGHDSHLLYTLSAVQILATVDALSDLESSGHGGVNAIVKFVAGLQDKTSGTFSGDRWGERDTRFIFCGLLTLAILDRMDSIDVDQAITYVKACENLDGSYGRVPGAESHAGQVYTCVGTLALTGRFDLIDLDRLGAWLSDRQLPNGGLNGRPEKLEDVCYSWWVLSSLAMIGKLHWIDKQKLIQFILQCQDTEHGGISDRPGDMVDVFHTQFGIAGLSLLGYEHLQPINPIFCMPESTVQKLPYMKAITLKAGEA